MGFWTCYSSVALFSISAFVLSIFLSFLVCTYPLLIRSSKRSILVVLYNSQTLLSSGSSLSQQHSLFQILVFVPVFLHSVGQKKHKQIPAVFQNEWKNCICLSCYFCRCLERKWPLFLLKNSLFWHSKLNLMIWVLLKQIETQELSDKIWYASGLLSVKFEKRLERATLFQIVWVI